MRQLPFRGEGAQRRLAPFGVAAAAGLLTVPLAPSYIENVPELVAGVVLTVLIMAAAVWVPWQRLPGWTQTIVPIAYIPVVALLRHAEGGGKSGFAILLILPVFWFALYGTRRALIASVVGAAVALVAPILVFGEPLYPGTEWRRAILFIAVAPVIGFTVQALVAEVRRQAADVVRERRRLEAILENLADGVIACDQEGRITLTNEAVRTLHSLPPQAPPLETWAERLRIAQAGTASDPDKELPLLRALRGEVVRDEELLVEVDGGRTRTVLASAQPIWETGATQSGAVVVIHDITDRKEAERLKDEFFALVSHELRTPLTSILGYIEILREDVDDPQAAQSLEVVDRNARRLQRLVGDLLFTAQLENGNLPLELGTVDLASVATEAVEALEHRARRRSIELSTEIAPIPSLPGDSDRLGQVLDNVISNALKYTPEGGRVDLRVFEDDAGYAVVEVEDTGIGISEEEQERLFERFFRASTATDRVIQGVGLGLAIVKAIVEGHGGSVAVRSEEGAGTTFRVELPMAGARSVREGQEGALLP